MTSKITLTSIKKGLNQKEEKNLSKNAALSIHGVRRKKEDLLTAGHRQEFSVDVDRILHSLSYARYIDKTQVFYLIKNDHITHRVLHVQLVSKIARTIGRFLGLNEDLIEAIALGHDIGHTPFGHDGESFLSELCLAGGIGPFFHNVQGVQFLDRVENKGKGLNLCLQTLDGVLCHDGEIHDRILLPDANKTFQTHEKEILTKKTDPEIILTPMTMEGCVVRMSDSISYVGRDIEDAIRLGMIKRSGLPGESVSVLGNTNGKIVYNLVTDIIENSSGKDFIAFSKKAFTALKRLKEFNYEAIYMNPSIKTKTQSIKELFHELFSRYIKDLENDNRASVIYAGFLENMSKDYIKTHANEEIVRDFIAGMTDRYFLKQSPPDMRPDSGDWVE